MVDSGPSNTAAAAAAGSIADTAAAAAAGRAGEVSPVVVDLGCGFGVGLLSLVQPPALTQPVNVLGCDACALKVGYARGVAARWGVSHAARFVCASAEATVAHVAAGDAAAPLLGVMVQPNLNPHLNLTLSLTLTLTLTLTPTQTRTRTTLTPTLTLAVAR